MFHYVTSHEISKFICARVNKNVKKTKKRKNPAYTDKHKTEEFFSVSFSFL